MAGAECGWSMTRMIVLCGLGGVKSSPTKSRIDPWRSAAHGKQRRANASQSAATACHVTTRERQ